MAKHVQETATNASGYGFVLDEDNMASDSATKVPTQQSTKAYVDAEVGAIPELTEGVGINLTDLGGGVTSISAEIDTDGTLASNSDTEMASQKATKTYADTKVAKAGDTMTGDLNITNATTSWGKITYAVDSGIGSGATGSRNFADASDTQPALVTGTLNPLGGIVAFGAGGSTAPDTTITRTAVGKLSVAGQPINTYITREAGQYYSMQGLTTASTSLNMTAAGTLHAHPVFLEAGTYDRVSVTTTVAAVSTWRFGVYPTNPLTGKPDGQTLILDCGTIDMNSAAGFLTATVSLTIPNTGVYWIAALIDAYTATPTVHGWTTPSGTAQMPMPGAPVNASSATAGRHFIARYATGVSTGSMPTTFPTGTWAQNSPRISLRAS